MILSLPVAFGFGNLAVLGWLAAAAAPILIHLWMRHTHRETRWAAMEFLREAIKRNARRLKLQQWLLLAVRTLALLLLVLAAAKPYLSSWNLLTGTPRTHHLLVLDASMSMQLDSGGESVFSRAKRLAQNIVDEAPTGDLFSLHVLDDSQQDAESGAIGGPASDAKRVSALLAALEPSFSTATLSTTLESLGDATTEAKANRRDLAAQEVLFFTDLASHTWQPAAETGGVTKQLQQLAGQAKLTVIDVGAAKPVNVSVSDLCLAGALATTVEALTLECEVVNHGDEPVTNLLVQLVADGVNVDEQSLSLAAGGSSTVAFDARLPEAGWRSLTVRTTGDQLTADDQAHLALDVRRQVRALLVEGAPQAARYLRHALDPGGDRTSPIEAIVAPESALLDTLLEDFDCVFLCNVARITSDERGMLDRYVRRGGLLVLFMGERILPEIYNEVLAGDRHANRAIATVTPLLHMRQAPAAELTQAAADTLDDAETTLLPASIGAPESSTTVGVDPLDYRHPIASAFRGSERAGLLSTPVWRYFHLTPTADAEVALALPSGDPLLVTATRGRGVVAMFATAASLDTVDSATSQSWTMLPAWPSFLPIVRELVAYGLSESRGHTSRKVGESLGATLPDSWAEGAIQITRPDGRRDSAPVVRTERGVEWSYASTDTPGVYSVSSASATEPIIQIAVNVPSAESTLSQVDIGSLPAELEVRTSSDAGNSQLEEMLAGASLHRGLLYAVLALLLIESVMAWGFSGRVA